MVAVQKTACAPKFYQPSVGGVNELIRLLQFNTAYRRSETFVYKSLVAENYIDCKVTVLIRSQWSHSSKNLLGNDCVPGIKDPK